MPCSSHSSSLNRSRLSRRQFLQTSAGALSGLALSGCGWTLAEVRPAIRPQGNKDELYVFTWSSYIDRDLTETFKTQTGIRVISEIYQSNEEMLAKFEAGKASTFSIIYPSDYKIEEMITKGYLSEIDQSRIQGLENLLPQFQNSVYDPGNRYSIPISWGTTGLIYNAEKLSSPPDDWEYLWQNQAQLSRKMTLLDDSREVLGATLKSLGYSYNTKDPAQIKQAYEKLLKLKPAVISFTTDAWKDGLLSGELLLSMAFSADAVRVIKENPDKPLRYIIPKSGSSLWSDALVIPKTAPNPDAGYDWINFMLQPAVAVNVTQRLFFATPNRAAFEQLPLPLRDNKSLFPPEEVIQSCERITPLDPKVIEVYETYWTRLRSG